MIDISTLVSFVALIILSFLIFPREMKKRNITLPMGQGVKIISFSLLAYFIVGFLVAFFVIWYGKENIPNIFRYFTFVPGILAYYFVLYFGLEKTNIEDKKLLKDLANQATGNIFFYWLVLTFVFSMGIYKIFGVI